MRFSKLALSLVFLAAISVFAQKPGSSIRGNGLYAEFFTDTTDNKVFVFYMVEHKVLIYNRTGSIDAARFSVSVEVSDSAGQEYFRESKESDVVKPEEPSSRSEKSQGLLIVSRNRFSKWLKIVFTDLNTGREMRKMILPLSGGIHERPARKDQDTNNISGSRPIVITGSIDSTNKCILANQDGAIPYSPLSYSLLISSRIKAAKVSLYLKSKDTTAVAETRMSVQGIIKYSLEKDIPVISILPDSKGDYYYCFENISTKLIPGSYSAFLLSGDDTIYTRANAVQVIWFERPETFRDPKIAFKILDIIDVDSDSLTEGKKEETSLWKILFDFWAKMDPTPGTAYNELMAEFYERADYANITYCTFRGNDGLNTDRGKVFLRFGKPMNTERVNTDSGKLGEIWTYKDGRKFYFVDKNGIGNYEIVKSL